MGNLSNYGKGYYWREPKGAFFLVFLLLLALGLVFFFGVWWGFLVVCFCLLGFLSGYGEQLK